MTAAMTARVNVCREGSRIPTMRVMFVHRWGLTMAGGELWLKNLSRYLSRQDVVIIPALHTRGPLFPALEAMSIPVHHVQVDFLRATPRWAMATSALGILLTARRLMRLAASAGIDVIHAFSPESAQSALVASRLLGIPLVVTIHNCGPYPAFDRFVLRQADQVIAVSHAVEQDLLSLGVRRDRLACIPVGIAFDERPNARHGELRGQLGVADDTPLVGMVANLEPKKAQDVLLRALPSVLRLFPTAQFVLLGCDKTSTESTLGRYEEALRNLAEELQVTDHVRFMGFCPDAATLISDLDVSVLCSRKEALGLAAVESLAARVPLIASDVEGLREVVDHGRNGLLVPPDDPDALAGAIRILLGNRELGDRLAAQGQETARQRFDATILAARNREIYQALRTNRKGSGAPVQ